MAVLVLPLLVESEIWGTLNLYRQSNLFLTEDLEIADIFALYVGVAIQNAVENQRLISEIKNI